MIFVSITRTTPDHASVRAIHVDYHSWPGRAWSVGHVTLRCPPNSPVPRVLTEALHCLLEELEAGGWRYEPAHAAAPSTWPGQLELLPPTPESR